MRKISAKSQQPTERSAHGGGRKTIRHANFAGEGAVHFGGWASVASRSKPPLSNRGVLLQKTKDKAHTKSRYETMYEVIRTYCTSHPVISTRQVKISISEAKNTRCMLLWAYAFFVSK